MVIIQYFHPSSRTSLLAYLFLRALQLGATTISCTIFCYLIYQHNSHYCLWETCSALEKKELIVPMIYISFVTLLSASLLSIFISTGRHLLLFIETVSEFPRYPVGFVDSAPVSEKPHAETLHEKIKSAENVSAEHQTPLEAIIELKEALIVAFNDQQERVYQHIAPCGPAYRWTTRTLAGPHRAAFLVDTGILALFLPTFVHYSKAYIWGPVLPYCPYIPQISGYSPNQHAWWAKLKVIDKECILSQVVWNSALYWIVFAALLMGVEGWWVRCELKNQKETQAVGVENVCLMEN